MELKIRSRNMTLTADLKERIQTDMERLCLTGVVSPDDSVHVRMEDLGHGFLRLEVTINTAHGVLRSERKGQDAASLIHQVSRKLESQTRKYRARMQKTHYKKLSQAMAEQEETIVMRTKTIHPVRMSVEQAVACMELSGHVFYLYIDDETGQPAVVYSRESGGYGLLEAQILE